MAISLEDSNGDRQVNPTEAQIRATLERIGTSLDHCILGLPGGDFIQTTGDATGLLLQYSDASGFYESDRSDFDVATVGRVFSEAAAGGEDWKSEYAFQKTGESSDGAGAAEDEAGGIGGRSFRMPGGGAGSGGASGMSGGGSLKDQILGQVKREISREASRGVGNLIRKGIRGITGRR